RSPGGQGIIRGESVCGANSSPSSQREVLHMAQMDEAPVFGLHSNAFPQKYCLMSRLPTIRELLKTTAFIASDLVLANQPHIENHPLACPMPPAHRDKAAMNGAQLLLT